MLFVFCSLLRHSHIELLMLFTLFLWCWWWCFNWLCCVLDFKDINECDTGNNTCTTAQVCFNFQGGFTCLNPLQCHSPYIEVSDKWVCHPVNPSLSVFIFTQLTQSYILLNWNSHRLPPPQSVYVFCWEPCLQGQTLHYSVPTHGLVVGAQCACRHLPDAGHHALPRRLLHLPDKIGQWRTRVLHESEYIRDENVTTLSCRHYGEETWCSHNILCWNVPSRPPLSRNKIIPVTYINII